LRKFMRSAVQATAAAAVVGVGVSVLSASTAFAATTNGPLTLNNPAATPLTGAQASTQSFQPVFPLNAHCSGDTATGQYTVYSYMVPAGPGGSGDVSLVSTVNFTGGNPSIGWFYPDAGGTPTPAQTTQITSGNLNTYPAGRVFGALISGDGVPLFGLTAAGHYQDGLIPTGQTSQIWETGLACQKGGVVTDYWNAEITISTKDATGAPVQDPNGFKWIPTPGSGPVVSEVPFAVALPIGGAAVIGGTVFLNRRRRRSSDGASVAASA